MMVTVNLLIEFDGIEFGGVIRSFSVCFEIKLVWTGILIGFLLHLIYMASLFVVWF